MRQVLNFRSVAAVTVALLVAVDAPRVLAQACQPVRTVPTGFQEYYVLGRESHVYNMMNRVATGEGSALTANATNSVVSAVTSANSQVVYYDQWEDGLDAGLNSTFPGFPNPQQASTLVFGDGNAANGNACLYAAAGCAGDVMAPGTALTLASDGGVAGACAPAAIPGGLNCSVPLPRNANRVRFDGGDRVVSSGGPLSLIHNQDPLATIIGGAVEVLSRQAYAGATSYSIPGGENLYLGDNSVTEIFQYVDIDLVAFENNTQVTINSPGATGGTVSFTLQQGQHYTNRNCVTAPAGSACANGLIDDATLAPFIRINAGTKISTSAPLAGMIHAGGDGTYATDIFPILPDLLHGNDYLIPSAGDNAGVNGNRPMNLFIFNPDPLNTIVVTATDSVGSRNFTVGPNSTVDYFSGAAPNRFVPADSTVRLTSTNNFWGLTVHDLQSNISDWGYAWLATKFLATSYTVGFAPGTRAAFPSCGPAPCNTANRAPIWVGATDDNTLVRIDLDNDGIFDRVDIDGNDTPDNGDLADPSCATPATLCVYRVNAPNSLGNRMTLRVFDHTDYDNTGTTIFATKPIAVVYGQDTDQGENSDQTPDTGYTIYPSLQKFLDPVLTMDKSVSPLAVSGLNGGTVTFTLSGKTYSFGPVTGFTVFDDLPAGLTCAGLAGNYVPNSSRITYPDLSQQNGDVATGAACAVGGGVSGRDRLSWTLSPNSVAANQTLTVEFQATIPAGATGCLLNDATDRGSMGTSVFQASDQVAILRTNVGLAKSVAHDGTPEPGDVLTYTMAVTNEGNLDETTVRVADVIPGGTSFVAASITTTAPFAGAYNAGQNAVVWTAATVPAAINVASITRNGTTATVTTSAPHGFASGNSVKIAGASPAAYNGDFTVTVTGANTFTYPLTGGPDSATGTIIAARRYLVSFQARIIAGTSAGTVVSNVAQYESAQTTTFPSNVVDVIVVGPALTRVKTVTPSPLHPNEVATFEITISNTGGGQATNLVVTDPLAGSNTAYLAGTLQRSINGAAFTALTDALADADGGSITGTTVQFTLASLPAGQDVRFRFQSTVNAGTGGQTVANQATVSTTQLGSDDTNLVQVPIIGNATVTGHVFLDTNGNGVQNAGEPNLAGVTVFVTDSQGNVQTEVTDAAGNYSVIVPAGATTLNVDQTSPAIPNNSTLTTANDPQNVTAVANNTVASGAVGFQPPPLLITKTSSANGTAVPGQTITYTVNVRNDTGVTQTGITLNDAVPAGATFVPGSAQLRFPAGNAIRVTEYPFTMAATTALLTLNQALAPDYFVIVQGSDVNGATNMNPSQDWVTLTDDPFGTGDFAGAPAATQLSFTRGGDATDWSGVVTVVECIAPNCATDPNGFQLLSAELVNLPAGAAPGSTVGTDTSTTAWTAGNLGQIMLMGGANGAGCATLNTNVSEHQVCHVRLTPSGTNTINWTRDNTGQGAFDAGLTAATVLVVQWGSAWTVQRAAINNANNGGDGINAAGEYNTVAINPVTRANTWVWGSGHTGEDDNGGTAEGVALTLGNGVAINATESTVAAGTDTTNEALNFTVYALTHPQLAVDYRFVAEGAHGNTNDIAINSATANRMALVYNDLDEHNTNWPRPLLSARYLNNTTVRLERRESGSNYAAWVQGINFNAVPGFQTTTCLAAFPPAAGNCTEPTTNANVVSPAGGFTLPANQTLTLTYQVTVDASGPSQITNTATVTTTQQATPRSASVTDNLVRAAVTVEPNNAGFTTPNSAMIFTHEVTNRGNGTDSFNLALLNENGWRVDLIDPNTNAVIATDSDGDGTWDVGTGTVNTGSLAVGASRTYWVRVSVPAGATAGTESTTVLRATSAANPAVSAEGTDEITVLGALGAIDLTPDHSGVGTAGSFVAYTHRVVNNTASTDTFDLIAASTQGWTTTFHYDSNGDGEYTDGVDTAIVNTAALAPGASQLIFARIAIPAGASAGATDVTILHATSRNNGNLYDSATDTTTVSAPVALDLSGGGTRMVVPGDLAVFPGTLYNLGTQASDFEFSVSASSLQGGDALAHPTELWIDTNNDGVFEFAAADSDGNGTWDSFGVGFNDDGDLFPDVDLNAGATMAYELRKPISASQQLPQEFVTLTARSGLSGAGEGDSITAQWLIAAVTRASIRGLRVDAAGVVEFATGMQRRTKSFNLYEVSDKHGSDPVLLNDAPVLSPQADSVTPIVYRVQTRPLKQRFLLVEEIETTGKSLVKGPYSIDDARLRRGLERVEARLDRAGAPRGKSARLAQLVKSRPRHVRVRAQRPRRSSAREGVRIEVGDAGIVELPLAELQQSGMPANAAGRSLQLTNLDRAVPFTITSDPVRGQLFRFAAEELATDHTGSNVYLLTWSGRPFAMEVPLSRSAEPTLPGFVRIEKTLPYVADAPANADPWLWDAASSGSSWPYVEWDPTAGDFDLPGLVAGASGPVRVRVRLASWNDFRHTVSASINGVSLGEPLTFDGATGVTLEGSLDASALRETGNALSLSYTAVTRDGGEPSYDGWVYLDFVDIAAPVVAAPAAAEVLSLTPYDPSLAAFKSVQYLIVTHPDFREAADRIASLKEAEGLETAVVETDNAYDRWSGGIVEARAIQALIQHAAAKSRRLKYVLLVGDDTFDPQNFAFAQGWVDAEQRVYVPSLLSRDSGFGRIPSENLFADLNGDGSPELAIGRLPVQSAEQANAMADKLANQTALLRAQGGRQLFVADKPRQDDAPFRAEADEAATVLGVAGSEQTVTVDVAQGASAAHAALLSSWQAGAMATHYFGHGGPLVWSDFNLLTVDDVLEHGHSFKATLLLMWTCDAQWYLNLGPSVGEALFLVPNGGAVASFGPSGIVAPAKHKALYDRVYGSLWTGQTLGEILRRAKLEALAEKASNRELIDGFNLLGDPALKLPAKP